MAIKDEKEEIVDNQGRCEWFFDTVKEVEEDSRVRMGALEIFEDEEMSLLVHDAQSVSKLEHQYPQATRAEVVAWQFEKEEEPAETAAATTANPYGAGQFQEDKEESAVLELPSFSSLEFITSFDHKTTDGAYETQPPGEESKILLRTWHNMIEMRYLMYQYQLLIRKSELALLDSLYVHNLEDAKLVTAKSHKKLVKKVKTLIESMVEIIDPGGMRYLDSVKVSQGDQGVFHCPKNSTKELLESFQLSESSGFGGGLLQGSRSKWAIASDLVNYLRTSSLVCVGATSEPASSSAVGSCTQPFVIPTSNVKWKKRL
ncbi:unnamed protein product [Linum trigynum]|uniref:Uncharacterized protein n=1 Tax=Linum trigynum TaxID=586398 RepID=A0AAV2GCQ3_9ROSI